MLIIKFLKIIWKFSDSLGWWGGGLVFSLHGFLALSSSPCNFPSFPNPSPLFTQRILFRIGLKVIVCVLYTGTIKSKSHFWARRHEIFGPQILLKRQRHNIFGPEILLKRQRHEIFGPQILLKRQCHEIFVVVCQLNPSGPESILVSWKKFPTYCRFRFRNFFGKSPQKVNRKHIWESFQES